MSKKLLPNNRHFTISAGTNEFEPEIKTEDTLLICQQRNPLPGDYVISMKDGRTNLHKFDAENQKGTVIGVVCESLRKYR